MTIPRRSDAAESPRRGAGRLSKVLWLVMAWKVASARNVPKAAIIAVLCIRSGRKPSSAARSRPSHISRICPSISTCSAAVCLSPPVMASRRGKRDGGRQFIDGRQASHGLEDIKARFSNSEIARWLPPTCRREMRRRVRQPHPNGSAAPVASQSRGGHGNLSLTMLDQAADRRQPPSRVPFSLCADQERGEDRWEHPPAPGRSKLSKIKQLALTKP